MTLPTDPAERKAAPVYSGVFAYFPDALKAAARCGAPMLSAPDEALMVAILKLAKERNHGERVRRMQRIASYALTLLQHEIDPGWRITDHDGNAFKFITWRADALISVAQCSRAGNDQHSPGKPLHWDKSKSQDEADALVRHLLESGTVDTDGIRHSAKVAWRALALLQREIEAESVQVSDVSTSNGQAEDVEEAPDFKYQVHQNGDGCSATYVPEHRPGYVPAGVPWEWARLGSGDYVAIWIDGSEVSIGKHFYWCDGNDNTFTESESLLNRRVGDQCRAFCAKHGPKP